VSLSDPQDLFAAENVVPLFKQSILTQPMVDATNAVSAKLTTAALIQLDAQVSNSAAPDAVASQWLKANGLA
jgi:osmoprotectant transport system substrate-binding protein